MVDGLEMVLPSLNSMEGVGESSGELTLDSEKESFLPKEWKKSLLESRRYTCLN